MAKLGNRKMRLQRNPEDFIKAEKLSRDAGKTRYTRRSGGKLNTSILEITKEQKEWMNKEYIEQLVKKRMQEQKEPIGEILYSKTIVADIISNFTQKELFASIINQAQSQIDYINSPQFQEKPQEQVKAKIITQQELTKQIILQAIYDIVGLSKISIVSFYFSGFKIDDGIMLSEVSKEASKEFYKYLDKAIAAMNIEVVSEIKKEIERAGLINTRTLINSVSCIPITSKLEEKEGKLVASIIFQIGMVDYGWILEWGSRHIKGYRFVFRALSAISARRPGQGFQMLL